MNVYLVSAVFDGEKVYKIGYTRRKPEQRIKEFKTGSIVEYKLVDYYNSKWATKIEANLHHRYRNSRARGEWFYLEKEDVDNFQENCKLIDKNFTIISEQNTWYNEKKRFN